MSLEVGAGIKRQAEEGFLFRGWGQRMYFGAPTQCQGETGGGVQFCSNGSTYRGGVNVRIFKTLL